MINIVLNGQDLEIPNEFSIAQLLDRLHLDPRQVAVERNREIVPRAAYGATSLHAGDALEIVTFVGGG